MRGSGDKTDVPVLPRDSSLPPISGTSDEKILIRDWGSEHVLLQLSAPLVNHPNWSYKEAGHFHAICRTGLSEL